MLTEEAAKNKLLDFLSANNQSASLFEITECRISENKDYWILNIGTIDPHPAVVGNYGYLIDNETGKIIVCGYDQHPDAYIQDKYDLERAEGKSYILACSMSDSKDTILKLKEAFNIGYPESIDLVRNKRNWFNGKKRHLIKVKELLIEVGIVTKIELHSTNNALIEITQPYWWLHEVVEAIKTEVLGN